MTRAAWGSSNLIPVEKFNNPDERSDSNFNFKFKFNV
jgi:hypothetical protein